MSSPDRDWPLYFDQWPTRDQVAYLELRFRRDELMHEIARLAGLEELADRELDPSTARFRKRDLAQLALFLGVYSSQNPDQRN